MKNFDVQVLGAGIVGRSLALALARAGLSVALRPEAARAPDTPDVRAYALNAASVALLQGLKVWDALPAQAATPVLDMHVQGDAHASAIDFSAWQQQVGALAWITDAAVLERELATAVRFAPHITVLEPGEPATAALTALCEGKASATRESLGIAFERVDYGHKAIAARLQSTRAHQGIARQWFRAPDVLALLPFDTPQPQQSFALVWSLPDAQAAELLALDAAAFEQRLMQATAGEAGELKLVSERAAWPLMRAHASAWCGPGWVLLGDAAHVVHPLAGQGLNLGLADVAALVRVIREREAWRPLGDEKLLRRYARERTAPTWAMGQVTDGLLRLFADDTPALRELRNRGLTLVDKLSPLKRWLTARALNS
ncbi:FAD-dependent monooxygenase [Rhizobacter sp. Root404]|jgi:2-polyprenyl-6-methoxyphenol hydroxylase-like FAD-dependent oxidoreductase|uniref:FAD-dependent monooxygenase n=1 Tax=Rhizobacter sp. Root404 TaxID=1736528 RepID=UPI0007018B35|nr:FAD-dependent monooxygenase [Rhizobacter sp. Root404]KQW38277.1 2-octaprenyl-3-methyl-6-methoxy-1,4-benzoquinol hydroxylase [Rhizobacter sp. Root404]